MVVVLGPNSPVSIQQNGIVLMLIGDYCFSVFADFLISILNLSFCMTVCAKLFCAS